jgi:protein-S-isoprenylcysteine O-methyltransferase Ste14
MLAAYCGGAGRIDLWPGWCFAAFYLVMLIGSYLVMARVAPDLIVERVSWHAGIMPGDKPIVMWLMLGPIVTCVVAGLDARWNGIAATRLEVALGYLLGIVGALLTHSAMAANRFYASTVRIQKERGHQVIDSGPYRLVRHPGNLGNVLVYIASPFMLASRWAWIPSALSIVLTIVRTVLEDRMLRRELPGYEDFTHRTTKRLVPAVW